MKIITHEEMEEELIQGAGMVSSMGDMPLENGKTLYLLNDTIYLVNEEDTLLEEFQWILKAQEKQRNEIIQSHRKA